MLRWGQREAGQSRGRKEACGPHRGAGGHSGGLAEPWCLQAGGWPWVWEKQREPEGGRWQGWGGGCSLSLGEISHDHKGRRNEQRTKADRTQGGRQINRAGEGGEPHSHQTQELLGQRDLQIEKVIYALSSTRRRVRGEANAMGVARSGARAAEATQTRGGEAEARL